MWVTGKFDRVTQKELVKISRKYTGINSAYLTYIVLTLLIMLTLIALPLIVGQATFFQERAVVMASLTLLISGSAISQGLFALRKGVYPTSKFFGKATTYAYAEDDRIEQLGRKQIVVALVAPCISFLIGFIWK